MKIGNNIDLTNTNQKIFAGVLIVGVLALFHFLLPPLVVIMKNLILTGVLGAVIVFAVLNRNNIWMLFKQLSWNITKNLISGDKLGYMYRYHDYLLNKIGELDGSIKKIGAIRVQIQRKVKELQDSLKTYLAQEEAARKQNKPQTIIRTIANKVKIDNDLLANYVPRLEAIIKQEKYLIELHDNWEADAGDLKYTLDAKKDEYNTLKELNKAAGTAGEFLKGSSEEYKIYQESLRQIEDSVTQYTANLQNFERKAQPILMTASMERVASEDEGLRLIEEYRKNTTSLRIEG